MLRILYFSGFIVLYYLFLRLYRGVEHNNIENKNLGSILFCFITYSGVYAMFGSELVNIWSAVHSIAAFFMILITPIIMLVIGIWNFRIANRTVYHNIVIFLSLGYILILGSFVLYLNLINP